jgi:signal transduction histidine kinase
VEGVAERLQTPTTLKIAQQRWHPDVESTAYLVVSEALANVAKHAGACVVEIGVDQVGDELEVRVADHGAGSSELGGASLPALRDRLAALGGTLRVHSEPGKGTTVVARIPCD